MKTSKKIALTAIAMLMVIGIAAAWQTNTGLWRTSNTSFITSGPICQEATAGSGPDVCLTRSAANTLSVTQGDGVTAASFLNPSIKLNNATSGTITVSAPTGALGTPTVTLPALTGSVPVGYSCGASLAANGACANTSQAGTFHAIFGTAILASNTSTITGISPAFTSTTSWNCVADDITTRANPVQAIPASASTLTITNTTGATDLVSFVCWGN